MTVAPEKRNWKREKQMKAFCKVAGLTSMLLLLAFGLLYSARTVSAAADGKITGTVKLDGAAPAHEGHRHVQRPVLRQTARERSLLTWRM
jgi:hypothetical protein